MAHIDFTKLERIFCLASGGNNDVGINVGIILEEKILLLLKDNPKITANQLAEMLKVTNMKLKNFLIVVNDIETSKSFYQELFGLRVLNDFDKNVILTEGLVLQEKKLWEKYTEKQVTFSGNDAELYFEENDMDAFLEKLNQSQWKIEYVNPLEEGEGGQRVIRLYDPDKHVIEVKDCEHMESVKHIVKIEQEN